ncbi:hypothetical protein QCA50_006705 [Cerrena zonata]|uniref:Uncharacterized protein n=1 Tax=Cerrena zonata TaxID=2478898 RepID=A0AAW0G9J1_9APHY
MHTTFFLTSVTTLAVALILQQSNVFAAPVSSPLVTPPSSLNTTEHDLSKFLLEIRDTVGGEFVGFHGTTADNANFYQTKKPGQTGIGIPPHFNGNDGELSPGLYVSDDIFVSRVFANSAGSKNRNKGLTKGGGGVGSICAVTANNQAEWRNDIKKVWIPAGEIAKSKGGRNDPAKLELQRQRVVRAGGKEKEAIRFSILDTDSRNAGLGHQMLIPVGSLSKFTIGRCLPLPENPAAPFTLTSSDFNQLTFPRFDYRQQATSWHIVGDTSS